MPSMKLKHTINLGATIIWYKYSYKYSHLKIYPPFPLTALLQGTLPLLQMLLLLLSFFL